MPASFQLLFDGTAADDAFYAAVGSLEVEENLDLPGAIELTLPVGRTAQGEPSFVDDPRLRPYANVAVVVQAEGAAAAECIFDGFVLSHKLHLGRGLTGSSLRAWGQDASWLMNLDEKVREWVDLSDADVAASIFGEYGFAPADANAADASPTHPESGHTLMQRATDAQFLRDLARRSGKLFRVFAGTAAGEYVGFFARPELASEVALTLRLNDAEAWNVDGLDLEWDVARPSDVRARQALFDDAAEDGVDGSTVDSGLAPLDARALADVAGRSMSVLLTSVVDDAGELGQRAQAALRDAGWFVRCEADADVGRLGSVPRAGSVAEIVDVGSTHSGRYLVWSVRHTLSTSAHRVRLVLLRNALGAAPSGSGEGVP